MAQRGGAVHVVTTTRRYKGRVYKTHLLRRSYRDEGKVKNETLGNLSHLPESVVDLVRHALRGESFAPVGERLEIIESKPHGDVEAVLRAMRRLNVASVLSSRSGPEVDLVMGMVAARVIAPDTKLATTRWWNDTTLAAELSLAQADEDDLYLAMDWLVEHQAVIEAKLAARHLTCGSMVLYDLSSSYFEGTSCSLAALGHNRDGKKGKLQVNYGLLTDRRGCPIAVSVYKGNTSDSVTFLPQVRKLRDQFGLEHVVLVGDRGMISKASIEALRNEQFSWITALKAAQIRTLIEEGTVQLGLFDEHNLVEISHPDFPGERLMACRNPELAKLRAHKRTSLLDATTKELEKVRAMVARGTLAGRDRIGVRVGKVVNKFKVAKHFELHIEDTKFDYARREAQIAEEAMLDGFYVIRTDVPAAAMSAADAVRNYKALSSVERAFRCLKSVDLKVRPIHHRLENRVRAHIFLCMLAYYVEWHMREAWRELMFADEDLAAKSTRDPVAPAQRSEAAQTKALTHSLEDGTPAHSFHTLLHALSTIVRNVCRIPGEPTLATFPMTTTPNALQHRARELLDKITV